MKTLMIAALTLCASAAPNIAFAAPISHDDLASVWSRAPSGDRLAYARNAAEVCASAKCGSIEIKACMDEAFRSPLVPAMKGMSVAEGATWCMMFLKSQK